MQRAVAAYERSDLGEAERVCRAVLKAKADHFDALHLLGAVFVLTRRAQEANEVLSRAVSVDPRSPEAYNTLGVALRDLQRYEAALHTYDRALALAPDYAEAHANRGVALRNLGRHAEAVQSYERALALKPAFAEVHNNLGIALADLKRYPESMASYQRALEIRPDYPFAYGSWLHAKMQICDWEGIASHFDRLTAKIERYEKVAAPFQVLVIPGSPALQRRAAEIVVADKYPPNHELAPIAGPRGGDRIRIGYFSADFHEHATSHLLAELFERHDRSRFRLTAFSFGPDAGDAMRRRVAAAFDEFIDVRSRSDREVALLARSLEIDIAVDLKGFTQNARPGIFAFRAAPIQVNYLGYPGTMGAPYFDYLIADATLVPPAHQQHYSERVVYLPNSYQPNDTRRPIADRQFSREALGLPTNGFVFCCFNNSYKIAPATFDTWMRILGRVGGSVLWLLQDNEWATANLKQEAAARRVSADRLVFAPRMPLPEHLARHRAADLFLDTLPCNAHTTASDALWADLPVVTCPGETFAGRVAASLLHAIGLDDLVTESAERYEELAVNLATDARALVQIRQRLADNRLQSPLFDTRLFATHLERAYVAMHDRYRRDLPPEHIRVQA